MTYINLDIRILHTLMYQVDLCYTDNSVHTSESNSKKNNANNSSDEPDITSDYEISMDKILWH